ncbi:unnamed protein product [Caenorhabditis brenneri]
MFSNLVDSARRWWRKVSSPPSQDHQHEISYGIEATHYFNYFHVTDQQLIGHLLEVEKAKRVQEMSEPDGNSDENVLDDIESYDHFDEHRRESQSRGASPLSSSLPSSRFYEDSDSDDSDWTDEWSQEGWEFSENCK